MKTGILSRSFFWAGLPLWLAYAPLPADPGPGDIFREYVWRGPFVNAGNWQRVTDPQATNEGAHVFLPNPVNTVTIDDLDRAVRAEVYIELWGGHAGTTGKRLRLNGNDWIPIEEDPNIPGTAGSLPAECYQQLRYPSVAVPLDQLQQGENTFEFTSGGQICFNFGWGQWGVYGVTFRVYYDEEKPHPQGRVLAPQTGDTLNDTWNLSAEATSATSTIERVDFIGHYLDFDYEGNGQTHQWHYTYRYGQITRHLGTANRAPYNASMDAAWVPDQPAPMQIMARIRAADGINYMTPAVDDLRLRRAGRQVKMYVPHQVPARWQTRAGRRDRSNVFVAHDLQRATTARMVLTTWSGDHADAIGLNDSTLVQRVGRDHDYSYDVVPVPLRHILQGTNTFFTFARTEHHGIEVLWPGIVLLVEYSGLEETALPERDLAIYADAPDPGWRVDHVREPLSIFGTELDTAVSDPVFSGDRAIELQVPRSLWRLDLIPELPVPTAGYRALHFAFRRQTANPAIGGFVALIVNKQSQSISLLDGEVAEPLDLFTSAWQTVEIPLEKLGLSVPYIESISLSGAQTGTVFLDDVRLVASDPITAVVQRDSSPTPRKAALEQNYPNPFNSGTVLRYTLAQAGPVELTVYNLAGQRLAVLEEGIRAAGQHTVQWNGQDTNGVALASGVYLYRLRTPSQALSRRLVLVR